MGRLDRAAFNLFAPKELKEMLNKLKGSRTLIKGSRTLILLVIANLPGVADAVGNVLSGVGQGDLAANVVKIVAGLGAVLTVIARVLPADELAK
jgi:hypothetical protein